MKYKWTKRIITFPAIILLTPLIVPGFYILDLLCYLSKLLKASNFNRDWFRDFKSVYQEAYQDVYGKSE